MTLNGTKKWDGKVVPHVPKQILTPSAKLEYRSIASLKRPNRPLRKHPEKQIRKICELIENFQLAPTILVNSDDEIIDGVARLEAAIRCGIKKVPVLIVDHLDKAQVKALSIALNNVQDMSTWEPAALRDQLETILELEPEFELETTTLDLGTIDLLLMDDEEADDQFASEDLEVSTTGRLTVAREGDTFVLNDHRLHCGDTRNREALRALMTGRKARMIMSDPPFNVKIKGHVSGLGRTKHREFVAGSGEFTPKEFEAFLKRCVSQLTDQCEDGTLIFLFIDWRSAELLLRACRKLQLRLINICVWNKGSGGMGSLYRSQHELVCVFKFGDAAHVNNVELGRYGRYRTNVWDYAGLNTFGKYREEQLAAHPTVKPVALVADAIKDASKRGDIILDGFAGSGTTLIAAERIGRRAFCMELDPAYVDVAVRRFEKRFGIDAIHEATGLAFRDLAEQRRTEGDVLKEAQTVHRRRVRTRSRVEAKGEAQ